MPVELGAGLDTAARVEDRLVDRQLDARRAGAGRGARPGTCAARRRCVSPAWAHGPGRPFEPDLEPAEVLRVELVDPDLLERVHGDVAAEPANPIDLHRADVDVPGAVALEVDEGVGNAERHLVAQLRRAERVADDQDIVAIIAADCDRVLRGGGAQPELHGLR